MSALVSVGDPCADAEDRDGTRNMLDAAIDLLERAGWTTDALPNPPPVDAFRYASYEGRAKFDVPIGRAADEIAGFLRSLPSAPARPIYLISASFAPRSWRVSVCYPSDASETN